MVMDMWAEPIKFRRAAAPAKRAVCVTVRGEARDGADEDFEHLLKDLAYAVDADEPGCTSYVVTRQMGSDRHFAVHARFVDWRAFRRHAVTPHFNRMLPRLTALLAAPVSMEIFLEV
jgi:quinol monooxygenase YgiN